MNIDEKLHRTAVIGAAGKMGRGIALLLLTETITRDLELKRESPSRIFLIDRYVDGLKTLEEYLDVQMLKFAERNVGRLRGWYSDNDKLIDNSEIIDEFLKDCRTRIMTMTTLTDLNECKLVFEAVFESIEIKSKVYQELKTICASDCLYFTNTSSIPISAINNSNDLQGRIIGFHFYNPPAVQKLVELISMDANAEDFIDMSKELIARLGKLMVPSNDIAGFIGNGHFIREGLFYLREILKTQLSQEASMLLVNRITNNYLIRPMGMLQLIDYVGLDVFKMICSTMSGFIEEDFSSPLLDTLLQEGIKGGQFGNGSQKDGFLQYQKGGISGIYSPTEKAYKPIDEVEKEIKDLTSNVVPKSWKELSRDRQKDEYLKDYFEELIADKSNVAQKALSYLHNSREISRKLVSDGVAANSEDVNSVMTNGFYHLYGPDSHLLNCLGEE